MLRLEKFSQYNATEIKIFYRFIFRVADDLLFISHLYNASLHNTLAALSGRKNYL